MRWAPRAPIAAVIVVRPQVPTFGYALPNGSESEPSLGRRRRDLGCHFSAPRARGMSHRGCRPFLHSIHSRLPGSSVAIATSQTIEISTNLTGKLGD